MKMLRIRVVGVIAALIAATLFGFLGAQWTQNVHDAWQRASPRDLSGTPVRIVWVDEKAVHEHGLWPWPRRITTLLIEAIAAQQPKVIGLDMLFPDPDRNSPAQFVAVNPGLAPTIARELEALPGMDAALANAVGNAPVVLGRAGVEAEPVGPPPVYAHSDRFSAPLPKGVRAWPSLVANIAEIDDVGLGYGLLNGDRDPDGRVRRVPLGARSANVDWPGFALELALIGSDVQQVKPLIGNGSLSGVAIGNRNLPTRPDGTMALRLGEMPAGSEFSAYDVLRGAIPADAFAGKIVIVGVKATGTADVVATALAPAGYGSSVQANAVDTILRGTPLMRPGWAWAAEAAIAIAMIALTVHLLPRLHAWAAALIALAAMTALFAASWLGFARFGVLLDPVGPSMVALAAGVTMLLMLFVETRREQRELALSAAKSAGELSAARDIQLGMLPPPQALAALDPAVKIDAFVEPARSIGGDFFDAMTLPDGRIAFLVADVTGKGVPAALFMALSKALGKSVLLRDGEDLGGAITRLNDEIARDNSEDMFVTMLAGLIDPASGAVELCNAGHEHPLIVRSGGGLETIDADGGPPLAVAPGFPYGTSRAALARGDSLVVVSDGITEAQNRDGKFFGHERVTESLALSAAGGGMAEAGQALRQAVLDFEDGIEATDDVTVLTLRYAPAT